MIARLCRALMLALIVPFSHPADAACADVGLVLAIDASGSINGAEFEMQRRGYFDALTAAPVKQAFAGAGVVDVAALFWGDSSYAPQVVPWHRIRSEDDLHSFAVALLSTERRMSGDTHIGNGLAHALAMFDEPGRCADRRVIDLSGDGRASSESGRTPTISLAVARDLAERADVTINALAITSDDPGLPDWYRRFLINGPFAFVLHVEGLESFGQAMARKLVRELIAGVPVGTERDMRPL